MFSLLRDYELSLRTADGWILFSYHTLYTVHMKKMRLPAVRRLHTLGKCGLYG